MNDKKFRREEYVKPDNKDIRPLAGIGLIIAGICLVVLGIHNGDVLDVMNKAIRICYECIGIG